MKKHPVDHITDEWWKNSTRETYIFVYRDMVKSGMSKDEAIDWLTALYSATAEEFGG